MKKFPFSILQKSSSVSIVVANSRKIITKTILDEIWMKEFEETKIIALVMKNYMFHKFPLCTSIGFNCETSSNICFWFFGHVQGTFL